MAVPLRINLDLAALRSKLDHPLTLAYQRVAAGLATSERVEQKDLVLPNAMVRMGWTEHSRPSIEQIQDDYRTWVLGNGFRDAIEAVHLFLDEVRHVSALLSVGSRHEISREELNRLLVRDQQKFHRLGFPEKFEILAERWDMSIPEFYRDAALSFNAARNCLVHRGGLVDVKDLNSPDALEVRWRRLEMVVITAQGDRELQLGEQLKEGELGMRLDDVSRRFGLGERVLFGPREFSDIAFTLTFISDFVFRHFQDRAMALGAVERASTPDQVP